MSPVERVNVVTTGGVLAVELGDEDRSVAARHVNAATHYRDTGEADRLSEFKGVTVEGHQLETRTSQIELLAAIGELDFEEFYED